MLGAANIIRYLFLADTGLISISIGPGHPHLEASHQSGWILTCRENPGDRPSAAPDSWVCPYLYRSNQAQSFACVVLHIPHSGRGRRASGGWTRWAHGPGTTSAPCDSASCCTFHLCWRPPYYRWRCRRSGASCRCRWDCRPSPHRDTGCRFSQRRHSWNPSGLRSASLTEGGKKEETIKQTTSSLQQCTHPSPEVQLWLTNLINILCRIPKIKFFANVAVCFVVSPRGAGGIAAVYLWIIDRLRPWVKYKWYNILVKSWIQT